MAEHTVPSSLDALDLVGLRARVDAELAAFLNARTSEACSWNPGCGELLAQVCAFVVNGGKRLRPLLSVLGWQAAAPGCRVPAAVLRVAASLELFHAFALIHDDVMDDSDLRLGHPTVHRAMAKRHERPGDSRADRIGVGAAILAGDLALAWSDELLHTAGLHSGQLAAVLPLVDMMRKEIVYGQYLDLTSTLRGTGDVDTALAVARYKTAKYTFERPLHLGAALADAPKDLRAALSAYALPAGEAFQLRDDLLGVFGDPAETGKPVLDDLRQGKPTVLVAVAYERATPRQRGILDRLVGSADLDENNAPQVRRILVDVGAVDTVKSMIRARYRQAIAALGAADLAPPLHAALSTLAGTALERSV
ncbi:polyprenyl synthetase family protein [Streptomyces spiramyceticus]|uniref:polyprenyl synthetase family protein n=1 Tax=Streptomyces spiramyceticus TaxID=299717 RepID=UPI00237A19C7|nr:polyprenyl synthetase family protein [Streptomyces spiramyceticus]